MRSWLAALALALTTPAGASDETGWRLDRRAGLSFAHPSGGVVLAVKGPRIARGTYGIKFEVRF